MLCAAVGTCDVCFEKFGLMREHKLEIIIIFIFVSLGLLLFCGIMEIERHLS